MPRTATPDARPTLHPELVEEWERHLEEPRAELRPRYGLAAEGMRGAGSPMRGVA